MQQEQSCGASQWMQTWKHYAHATGLSEKTESVQVSTLLTVIGALARRVLATFEWNPATSAEKIQPVLDQFEAYCRPR